MRVVPSPGICLPAQASPRCSAWSRTPGSLRLSQGHWEIYLMWPGRLPGQPKFPGKLLPEDSGPLGPLLPTSVPSMTLGMERRPGLGTRSSVAALTGCPLPVHSLHHRGPTGQHPYPVPALLPGYGGEHQLLGLRVPPTPHLLEPRGSCSARGQQVRSPGPGPLGLGAGEQWPPGDASGAPSFCL